jgi:alkyldihydroxyacetonephosphate synthase
MGAIVPPIQISGGAAGAAAALDAPQVDVDEQTIERLQSACRTVTTDPAALGEAGRDWWPLGMIWATAGTVPARPFVVAQPATPQEVAAVVTICNEAIIPLTAAGGRSGVCGGAVPLHGGVAMDLTHLTGLRGIDHESLTVDVLAGTFGDDLEAATRESGLTIGHWPQSMALSTVGGWLACRSAGQMSNRYGKIEDIVVGLDVVLADGSTVSTGGAPRAAVGPDLNQIFVGSEGALGIITGARLRAHPVPPATTSSAWGFDSFGGGLDACRGIIQRGSRAAVLRLYDHIESQRNFSVDNTNLLLVYDEGDPAEIAATEAIVDEECSTANRLDAALVDTWMGHRNDVSALEALISKGYVVDTMEMSAPWSKLNAVHGTTIAAIGDLEETIAVSVHQSHAYTDGACLYFTFGGQPALDDRDDYYREAWETGTRAALSAGASLSHHHGIGLNRAEFVANALGSSLGVLSSLKAALDPKGILNPGKLGLDDPFRGDL